MAIRLSDYLKNKYGEKVYRLSLTSGCTCPNRDGSIVLPDGTHLTGGCTFCSEGGSGEFAADIASVDEQIEDAKRRIQNKTDARKFIAYFQSYTNTYGDVDRLKKLYLETIQREDIEILSIGTRPDCLEREVLQMLRELREIKPVWIELGLQTIHEETAEHFHRGYTIEVFEEAYKNLKEAGIEVIVHVIFGLPGETKEDMLETVGYLSDLEPSLDGIKLQNLQILKGTQMYEEYKENPFHILTLDEHAELIMESLKMLPGDTVIHRMTGDGPRRLLVEPLWSLDKKNVLNTLNRRTKGLL
ncbi:MULTISPECIES: TIGR01212 family radical SAM protein [unclassified Butyrivibrio]|uniref:TIGR01212 family radical SAM protein n=1 Tax=unclassified Butyrivibrio TaxID=2639466 RepID=UPI0003B4E9F6|nr:MULTISPECIES: TIGR01212 family radical SAM protein [unclassified Butyrivibrio]